MPAVTLEDQIKEIRREIAMRNQVYPNMVASDRMTEANARQRISVMCAVLTTLQGLQEESPLPLFDKA